MKTKIELGILLVIFLLSSYLIYTFVESETENIVTNEEIKFKEEYESLNGKYNEYSKKYYMDMEILVNSNVEYRDATEIIEILKNETGIIYFGFPECPWCRNLVPVLVNKLSEYNVPFYYYNAYDIRDKKHLDENGNVVTDKEGTTEYYEIVNLLSDFLGEYEGLNNKNTKRLYFPTVVFVKNGKVIDVHIGTVDSQTDPSIALSEEQILELGSVLEQGIVKTLDIVCDESC